MPAAVVGFRSTTARVTCGAICLSSSTQCVRFATTVASGHATLATKRTLLLTWAGLPPAGSHQLCLAHSFDHLVSAREQRDEVALVGRLLLRGGLRCRLPRDEFPALRRLCPGIEEHEPQAAR